MKKFALLMFLGGCISVASAQLDSIPASLLNTMSFRNIGPATTSGRISDIVVNPHDKSEWYIASAAGGIFKTNNAGTTFQPIFDNYGTTSIGCITLDPNDPNVVWVGTGENNNQRSVSYGNGVYKSLDGGKSFTNVGLKLSEHIGMIQVDPRNGNVAYVAAYGPVWKEGGERGLYKTEDGGKTWNRIQFVSENTGCNEVHLDPSNPDIVYAAFHQRRRREWTYIGGGPESAIYKSVDGGKTWKKIHSGIPGGDLGRIALAISPAMANRVYAMVEAQDGKGGLYVSEDRGESWVKKNGFFTAGNYYQELKADPIDADRVFIMDTWLKWSKDGGTTVSSVGEQWKHVDNHAIWIDPKDTRHFLVGCDGGLYETWDNGAAWHFKENLPITQFYRVAADNALPFYNVYGGTQDNNTIGGPSQNGSANGIPNSDWFITVGGDGFKSQVDPSDPNIVYSQWQYGGLIRFDRRTGEQLDIKPIAGPDDKPLRWNWDAPLVVSQHESSRLYFAANRIYRSNDRGNSWVPISDDLTRGIDRNTLPEMGRTWSMDAVAKNQSVSIYGNITYLAESTISPDVLIAGTDDGLVHITDDGGKTWTKFSKFPGIPDLTLVTSVFASQFEKNTFYVTFDNHRSGDFKPYIFKTSDAGATWVSISNNLPKNGSIKAFNEDFIDKNLLFVGTEFGLFVSNSGGKKWTQWNAGLPPVPIKDIVIQKRENDLILATFGRGFAILDNYAPLRNITKSNLDKEAYLFPVKEAKIFIPKNPIGGRDKSFKGATYFNAPNPPVGAVIWYHLKNDNKTIKELRQEKEKDEASKGKGNLYPTNDSIRLEALEEKAFLLFIIRNDSGQEVRRLRASANSGMRSIVWDLRYSSSNPLTFGEPDLSNPYTDPDFGPFVTPGKYQISMQLVKDGQITPLGNTAEITCDFLFKPTIEGIQGEQRVAIIEGFTELRRNAAAAGQYMAGLSQDLNTVKKAISYAGMDSDFAAKTKELQALWNRLNMQLNGDNILASHEFETTPGIYGLIETSMYGLSFSTVGPTQSHIDAYKQAKSAFDTWTLEAQKLDQLYTELQALLDANQVPYTPGRKFFLNRN